MGIEANIANFSGIENLVTATEARSDGVSGGEPSSLAALAVSVTVRVLLIANFSVVNIQLSVSAESATALYLGDNSVAWELDLVDNHAQLRAGGTVRGAPAVLEDVANFAQEVVDDPVTAIGTSLGGLRYGSEWASTVSSASSVGLIANLASIELTISTFNESLQEGLGDGLGSVGGRGSVDSDVAQTEVLDDTCVVFEADIRLGGKSGRMSTNNEERTVERSWNDWSLTLGGETSVNIGV